VGGGLSLISLQTPAFVAGILSLLTVVFGFFVLPESLPPERRQREPIALKELNPLRQVGGALRRPVLRRFLLASFAQNFAFSGLATNFALFTFVRFKLGPEQNGGIFAYIGLVSGLMQGSDFSR
jgi:DHA1 family tetracycline resistance protein-like MFS transporter